MISAVFISARHLRFAGIFTVSRGSVSSPFFSVSFDPGNSSSCGAMFSAVHSAGKNEVSGRLRPVSHFETTFALTPIFCASCSCVNPSALLRAAITSFISVIEPSPFRKVPLLYSPNACRRKLFRSLFCRSHATIRIPLFGPPSGAPYRG